MSDAQISPYRGCTITAHVDRFLGGRVALYVEVSTTDLSVIARMGTASLFGSKTWHPEYSPGMVEEAVQETKGLVDRYLGLAGWTDKGNG